jgi:dipeptidyl aminopeptidase/acylaminoacyl peptidase
MNARSVNLSGPIRLAARFAAGALALAVLVSALQAAEKKSAPAQRPMTPDDLFRIEELDEVAFSPDGKWLAYSLKRAKATASHHKYDFLNGGDRSDVWLVPSEGGPPRNLTNGASDGSGFWKPGWSPDSRKIAMLSTRGGNVRIWVWDSVSGELLQRTERGVDDWRLSAGIPWVSDTEFLAPVLPEGRRPLSMTVEMQAAEEAMRQWPKAWKGAETTVSVLESGNPPEMEKRAAGELLLLGARDGSRKLVAAPAFGGIRVSPDRRRFAVLTQTGVYQPDPKELLPLRAGETFSLQVGNTSGGSSVAAAEVADVLPRSIRWSPDGSALALIGYAAKAPDSPARVYRCLAEPLACAALTPEELDPTPPTYGEPGIVWSARGDLLVLAKPRPPALKEEERAPHWWLLSEGAAPKKVTSAMKSAPAELVPDGSGRAFWAVTEGDLWKIALDDTPPRNLTEGFEPKIGSIVWPKQDSPEVAKLARLILGAPKGAALDLYSFDAGSGRIVPFPKPVADAELAAIAPSNGIAAFKAAGRDGTLLWLSGPGSGEPKKILETNAFLRGIAEGQLKRIEYRGLDGEELKAWVLLPVGYREGTRYPMIAEVYAGSMAGDRPPYLSRLNSSICLNMQLLSARGYAVLFSSMPLRPEGEASDPYMELMKGVLPAVDRAVELGIADPKRLGVMGQSFGGFSTYGLVTQTDRFGAAVALAGLSDFISLYGVFDARMRYAEFPQENLFQMKLFESGQTRMGNPPWKDIGRYLRNSPLFYVDRVKTPLMIIQGDMDYVALQQGEQFFTALYRQGKRAAFVRYWGEGHVLEGPANIRDMWQRIYGWFDEHLKKPAEEPKKEKAKK